MGELWMSLVWMRKGWRGGREQRSDKLWRCSSKQFVSLLLSVIVSFPRCRFIIIRCCSAIHSFLTRWENWLWPSESRQPKSLIPIFCPQPPTKPCIKVQSKIFTPVYKLKFFSLQIIQEKYQTPIIGKRMISAITKTKTNCFKRPITCSIFKKRGVQGYEIWHLQWPPESLGSPNSPDSPDSPESSESPGSPLSPNLPESPELTRFTRMTRIHKNHQIK